MFPGLLSEWGMVSRQVFRVYYLNEQAILPFSNISHT
jgi:hypothetical protein